MNQFHGWNRIYLFYGVIFFLLGLTGIMLKAEGFWGRLTQTFHGFIADLRPYLRMVETEKGPEVAVMAPSKAGGVCLGYSSHLLNYGLGKVLQQCQLMLEERFTQVTVKSMEGDVAANLGGLSVHYPQHLILGLEAEEMNPPASDWRLKLDIQGLDSPPAQLISQVLAGLPDGESISFKVQSEPYPQVEVSWVQKAATFSRMRNVIESVVELWRHQTSRRRLPSTLL